jgi:hypothetical protein
MIYRIPAAASTPDSRPGSQPPSNLTQRHIHECRPTFEWPSWNTAPRPFQPTATNDENLAKIRITRLIIKKLVANNAK